MPRILRESASICFRLVTVSASYLSALSRSSWVSARIAARGFDRSWRSCLMRSEEHTSELQSRQYLVCRLLLEKKKQRRLGMATEKAVEDHSRRIGAEQTAP